jgi:iron complex outermembrane recepter protein
MLPVQRRGRLLSAAIKTILSVSTYSMIASAAQAEEAKSTAQLEEVVVTGFRESLELALEDKRQSAAAIDVIRAEDIAKFPDLNIAEAVQRIPGVSIARDSGEGRQITVRGLGPQFTRTRINGMEAMSSTGGTDSSGGANRNRSFDYNVFASELFNSITARKTASADVDEGSLGATIDLATARPFDYKEFTFVSSVQAGYNDLAEEVDPRGSLLISDTFADDRLGALFSIAYTKRHIREEGFSTVRWDNGGSAGGFAATPAPLPAAATRNTTFQPRIPRYGRLTHEQERLGMTGSLQWQVNDKNLFSFDILYSDFKANREEQFLEAFSFTRTGTQNGKPQTIVRDGAIDANGTMVYGLFDNVDIRSEDRYDELETQFSQYTLTGSHELTDRLKISELVGYSDSDFNNPIQTTVTLDRPNSNGYSWDFRSNDRLPALNYNYDVTNPANWQFSNQVTGQPNSVQSEIRLRPQGVKNTFKSAFIDLEFRASDALSVKGGVSYKDYTFESREKRRASETTIALLPAGVTVADVSGLVQGFGRGLNVPAGTPTVWLAPSIDAFNSVFNIYSNTGIYALGDINVANARGNNRSVEEEDMGAYAQMAFTFEMGVPFRGDLGVRYINTSQSSLGYTLSGSSVIQATADHEYSDVLPSLNLVAEITPELLVRFGAAKVMTRPDMGSVTPGGSINLVGNLTVSSGNPQLDPIRANSFDLSAEWYFDKGSLLSLALFYKDIESFIQTVVENKPFNTSGLPLDLLAGTTIAPDAVFAFTQPINSPGGPLKGFEINYQQPFNFLPAPFNHFGTLLNYTHVESTIEYVTSPSGASLPVKNDLTGLSGEAYNATLYYEDSNFSIRASAAYRDRYLTRVPGSNAGVPSPIPVLPAVDPNPLPITSVQDAEGTNETLSVDMSASYNVNSHFTLTLEGLNLTDQFNDQFIDTKSNRVVVYNHTGRQFFVGARYKF